MKLYVLRHGETKENQTGMMQGEMDTVLDKKGKEQALSLQPVLKEMDIDIIFCSPKKRTTETAILACPNAKIHFDDRLKSRDHGEFQGMSRHEINLHDYWNIKKNMQYERAESVGDLMNRVVDFLKFLKENYDDKKVLIVTHSGIVRILYYYFHGIPEDGDLLEYESTNASLEVYEY